MKTAVVGLNSIGGADVQKAQKAFPTSLNGGKGGFLLWR